MASSAQRWTTGSIATGDRNTASLEYVIRGTDSHLTALQQLVNDAAATYNGLVVESVAITERQSETDWAGEVRYRDPNAAPQDNTSQFSFAIQTESAHVTQSLATFRAFPAPGKQAPNFQGGIGFNGESFDGVDISVPTYSFQETHFFPFAVVTGAFKANIFHATGKVNADRFKGFQPGEVLFLGATGALRNQDQWEVTYSFAASQNVIGINVGPIRGIRKPGWDYLWVLYETGEDAAAKKLVKRPIAAYVEQVYERTILGFLGI